MDSKDLELFAVENVQLLKQFNTNLIEFKALLKEANENYVAPPSNVEVTGTVEVNTEPEVEITNMYEFTESVDELAKKLERAIEENSFEPLKEITVKNIKDAQAKDIKISNFNDLKKWFDTLGEVIKNNKPIVHVDKSDIKLPTTPREAIAVRLVTPDGKSFYSALAQAVSSGGGNVQTKLTRKEGAAIAVVPDNGDPLFANISASASGDNLIVAAVTGKKIKVLSVVLVASGAVSVKWRSNTTDKSGAMPLVANSGFVLPASTEKAYYFETAVGEALNINLSGAVGAYGHISYYEEI